MTLIHSSTYIRRITLQTLNSYVSKIEYIQTILRLSRATVSTMVQEKYANGFRCVTNMQINHFRTQKNLFNLFTFLKNDLKFN